MVPWRAAVLAVQLASAVHVTIDKVVAAGKCFETEGSEGITAAVSGTNVVVYDPDAPCPGGGSYIHYAGRGFKPMTAGAGPTVHTYHAGIFPKEMGMIAMQRSGKCAEEFTRGSGEDEVTWKVAAAYR